MNGQVLSKLSDGQVEGIAGGYIFNSKVLTEGYDPNPWEILDEKGDVVDRWDTKEMAERIASGRGFSTEELTWEQVIKLRETGSPY